MIGESTDVVVITIVVALDIITVIVVVIVVVLVVVIDIISAQAWQKQRTDYSCRRSHH